MMIKMEHVNWIREKKYLLKDINWEVKDGEHWAIVGLNGSGKTTLLNMVNGYIWPTKGQVSVLGQLFGTVDLRVLRKSIGWVSTSLQEKLYKSETSLEIVLSGKYASIGLFDIPEEEDIVKANQLINELGCSHLALRSYQTLSQGERQRILIARALMSSPKLLILDEPCTGLDVFAREHLLSTIDQLAKKEDAPTLLYVTHHVEEILPVFSHTLLLREGEIYQAGKSRDVLATESMTEFFNVPVEVEWKNNRPWLTIS
ncbi:molybdenum ABC transporter ATP-binding protein [Desulfuribacillus stibiiarsenatis]|uniref:Molybdenum ABC transporter ATP-binding protein n=1 Tax=Desulfuribacillus stibiiarsenatis TaxID=1390249 RepID=A0A1E5L254_9FIRM|nr:ABC transporter ATP-binding protein [Desulfuribacillus stibiiarsenatis]OEH84184.1 molybdenum ABC transporter ATP-binding protein [Desulfuribacillus stibiiarsenatis]